MIQINQLKIKIDHSREELKKLIAKQLKISESEIIEYSLIKRSIDARKKNDILFVYSVEVKVSQENKVIKRVHNPNILLGERKKYNFKATGEEKLKNRPVIIGTGPAGLFCGLMLAKNGYRPLLIERGDEVRNRIKAVEQYWENNELNLNSNVQFGEGGAGTFSDGKLNTLVKDEYGRNLKVLEVFAEHGAPGEILYLNKPHIGTDQLRCVVKGIREEIISLGGEVRFNTCLTDIFIENGQLTGIEVNETERIDCGVLVIAIGHSARDTFELIYKRGLKLSSKSFAIGVRIEHPQLLINKNQYGESFPKLPAADYKLAYKTSTGRSIYSFCMCPGGFVVNASSEKGGIAVNGMSNHARDEENANSALIITVTPADFPKIAEVPEVLSGVEFQRTWERKAYQIGNGNIPVQLFGDLLNNQPSVTIGHIKPNIKGKYELANLRQCLPEYVITSLSEGIKAFDRMIPGYADEEAVLSGVETRTSSPIRMERNEQFESNISGIYPCGEGAGYAGGITSAAMDGIKVFEAIANRYAIT
ncbi:NAD(P)/FAD-dependent oxidoreductase [Anaerocolumna sp. MB42-C2]|uniref:NAD(P)/FAD-dependent oxidoreductase n=1 Tax=Anaerocolumna sp. MB42-C2 TaxID=3070997 RepID=UPI0027DF3DD4|nr:NAD(P)/FAD-dependent oxidoreductase [Anaerocolumna sp. MB42-C2]WMJ88068.1 FAD-dependent oxidoreductase [Anaerocolumna sp. MB42-C2]